MVNQWFYVNQLDCTKNNHQLSSSTLYHNQTEVSINRNDSGFCFKNGQNVLEFLTLGLNQEWLDFFGLIIISIIFRLMAYLTLHYVAKIR